MDDDQEAAVSVRSNPHWEGDPSKVRGPASDGSYIIPARALHVTWGNDPRYWEWVQFHETTSDYSKAVAGFEEGAMLQQVNWLEVTGKFELETFSEVARSYKVYYVMKFNEDAFGWSHAPVKFKVKLQAEAESASDKMMEVINLQRYAEKSGAWHKIFVGEFKVVGNATVEVGMLEVETDWWKGSMLLAGILLQFIQYPN